MNEVGLVLEKQDRLLVSGQVSSSETIGVNPRTGSSSILVQVDWLVLVE